MNGLSVGSTEPGWNDDKSEKPERAIRTLFYGVARAYCEANDVVVDREIELGTGSVDFKFSNGYSRRCLLEVKKLSNGKSRNGLEKQQPRFRPARRGGPPKTKGCKG